MIKIAGFLNGEMKCAVCGKKFVKSQIVKIEKFGHVCVNCANEEGDYYGKNTKFVHNATKKGTTFSLEFETGSKDYEIVMLRKYHFIPTHDGSINGFEWKSPVYRSLHGVKKIFTNIEGLAHYVDDKCGTHIHVGTLSDTVKSYIESYEDYLFGDILNYMNDHRISTSKFWGREFTDYCTYVNYHNRYNCFNPRTDENPTLEFRLCKFINATQFYSVLKFCLEMTEYITEKIQYAIDNDTFDYSWKGNDYCRKVGEEVLNIYKRHLAVYNRETRTTTRTTTLSYIA
jgi:hypothetical protein